MLLIAGKLVVDEVLTCSAPLTPGSAQRAVSRVVTGGGQVWHTARAARRAGVSVAVTGWCGADPDSAAVRHDLVTAGVQDRLVEAGEASRAVVLVGPDGERLIVSTGGAGHLAGVDPGVLVDAEWLHLDGYALDDRSGDALVELAEAAYDAGVPLSLEPPSLTALPTRLRWVGRLPPLTALLGRPDEVDAVRAHLRGRPETVVTHDGPAPVRTVHRDGIEVTPVPAGEVATTGAGDRFAGGWLAAVLRRDGGAGAAAEAGIAAAAHPG